MVTTER